MAGAALAVTVDDARVRRALDRLVRMMRDPTPVLDVVGATLESAVVRRFEVEAGPGGAPWPVSARARRERGQTLSDTGRLRASITRNVFRDRVEVGTGVRYAGIHQFGGRTPPRVIRARRRKALFWAGARHPVMSVRHPGSRVPARPFLGLDRADEAALAAVLADAARGAWR